MLRTTLTTLFPGLMIAVICGFAAMFLGEHYGAPTMLFALLIGMALAFVYEDTRCKAGIDVASNVILKAGVAMLALRISFDDFLTLGWQTALMIALAICSTITFGYVLSRLLGLGGRFGVLTGGAVAICGASAAMALSSILPKHSNSERDTIFAIVGVTSLSTIAMVLYPVIGHALGFSNTDMGIFLGGTIHDVAQVVGAGYSVSEVTGDTATLTKLIRVSMLVPVIAGLLLCFSMKNAAGEKHNILRIPLFLVAFVLIMLVNNLVSIPSMMTEPLNHLTRFCLVVAIAAIGMKSNLRQLATVGIKPIAVMVLETMWLGTFIVLMVLYL